MESRLHLPHEFKNKELERIAARCRGGVMMQRDYTIDAPAIALTAGTGLWMIGAITSSTCPLDIIEFAVGCDTTSAGVLKVELCTYTTDGTGTAYTPKPMNGDAALTACTTTAKINYTVANSGTITVLRTWSLPTPTGPLPEQLPLGREITIPVSTKFGFRLTSTTVSPNAYATLAFEE